jgi:hypothetical protein
MSLQIESGTAPPQAEREKKKGKNSRVFEYASVTVARWTNIRMHTCRWRTYETKGKKNAEFKNQTRAELQSDELPRRTDALMCEYVCSMEEQTTSQSHVGKGKPSAAHTQITNSNSLL